MDLAYFIINNIKYMVDYNKYRLEIYKLVNDTKEPLTDKEREYFDNILKNSNSYILYSETLRNIYNQNGNINSNDKLYSILEKIEQSLPEGCQVNLHNNVGSLKIEYKDKLSKDNSAQYNIKDNIISLKNKNDEYKLVHELMHMASTKRDSKSNIIYTGLHEVGLEVMPTFETSNLALTEGITELITLTLNPDNKVEDSSYMIEVLLAKQLSFIVGFDTMLEAYFTNNISLIDDKLNDLIDNREISSRLFRTIELDALFRNNCVETNTLANIQCILTDYFKKKCVDLYFDCDVDKIKDLINEYSECLIDKAKIIDYGLDESKYKGLDDSVNYFYDMKEKFQRYFDQPDEQYLSDQDYNKKMGFIKVGVLTVLSVLFSTIIFALGILLIINW